MMRLPGQNTRICNVQGQFRQVQAEVHNELGGYSRAACRPRRHRP